jgi:hypothetical protein
MCNKELSRIPIFSASAFDIQCDHEAKPARTDIRKDGQDSAVPTAWDPNRLPDQNLD